MNQNLILSILRVTSFSVFTGRAWQHLFWDAPFRSLLWDERLLQEIIETTTDYTWQEYVTSPAVDNNIQLTIRLFGVFYLLCAILSMTVRSNQKLSGKFLVTGSIFLLFLSFLYAKEKFFHFGQFFEYSAQFSAPLLLYIRLFKNMEESRLMLITKIMVATTFICHGLYAVGYYPQPGAFTDMVINILHVPEGVASVILRTAGFLDFAAALLLFLPAAELPVLWYMVFWGLLTALARPVANVHFEFFGESLSRWWYEAFFRLPHALLPLIIITHKMGFTSLAEIRNITLSKDQLIAKGKATKTQD